MDYGLKPLGREKLWFWVMLVPTLIGLLFGTIGSVVATLRLSFADWDLINTSNLGRASSITSHYSKTRTISKRSTNTLKFTAIYVPGVVVISLLFVACLINRKIRGVSFFRTVYFPADCDLCCGHRTGMEHDLWQGHRHSELLLERFGLAPVCWLCTDNAMMSVVIVNIWGAIGEGMIIFLAGLTAIPRDYYEAAALDGANGFQQFFRITLPLVTPSIFFQTLISTINAFQAYDYIYMLTRRGQGDSTVPVVVFSIYRNALHFFSYGGCQCASD